MTAPLLLAALGTGSAAVLAALVVPRRGRPAAVGALTGVSGALGAAAGTVALLGGPGRSPCRGSSRSPAW